MTLTLSISKGIFLIVSRFNGIGLNVQPVSKRGSIVLIQKPRDSIFNFFRRHSTNSPYSIIIGCEYGGYSSDITRTWPINGSFTPAQEVLYDVILTVQKELIGIVQQHGGKTLDELFDTMCLKLGFYLQEVGLIPKSVSDLDLAVAAYKFCPHHVSHFLGQDVHDTPQIAKMTPLQPGMVFTIEPGNWTVLFPIMKEQLQN